MNSFSGIYWLIIGLVGWVLYKALSGSRQGPARFCKSCCHTGKTKVKTPGDFRIELVLWLCLIVPGLIYSIWRVARRSSACELCGAKELVLPNSAIATCPPEIAWHCSKKSCSQCWH